jgi:hypothetical protein
MLRCLKVFCVNTAVCFFFILFFPSDLMIVNFKGVWTQFLLTSLSLRHLQGIFSEKAFISISVMQ